MGFITNLGHTYAMIVSAPVAETKENVKCYGLNLRNRRPYRQVMSATIALVDDDRNILTSVSIAMQAEGYVTRLYPDGESALKAILENPADLGNF